MIRPAVAGDIPRVVEMGATFWAQTYHAAHIAYDAASMDQSCRDMLSHSYSAGMPLLWVVTADVGVVGAAGFVLAPMYANLEMLVLSELFWWVDPAYRKQGFGVQLLTVVENAALAAGVDFLAMMLLEAVEPEKVAALYWKLGYAATERTFVKRLSVCV